MAIQFHSKQPSFGFSKVEIDIFSNTTGPYSLFADYLDMSILGIRSRLILARGLLKPIKLSSQSNYLEMRSMREFLGITLSPNLLMRFFLLMALWQELSLMRLLEFMHNHQQKWIECLVSYKESLPFFSLFLF